MPLYHPAPSESGVQLVVGRRTVPRRLQTHSRLQDDLFVQKSELTKVLALHCGLGFGFMCRDGCRVRVRVM